MKHFTTAFSVALATLCFANSTFAQNITVDAECDNASVGDRAGFVDFDFDGSVAIFADDGDQPRLVGINAAQFPQCRELFADGDGEPTLTPTPIATPTPTPTPTPNPTATTDPRAVPATASSAQVQAAMLAAVNAIRITPTVCNGVTLPAVLPLIRQQALDASAQAHSADMAARNYFNHFGSPVGSSNTQSRAVAAGYTNFSIGENIAAGQNTVGAAIDAWLGSTSGHCEHLMTNEANEMGSGTAYNATSQAYVWTFVSGDRG